MIRIFINISIYIIVIALIMYIIYCLYNYILKKDFLNTYHIGKLPSGIVIRKCNNENEKNHYELEYPYWSVSKKDGTADKRVKNNSIIWRKSKLYIGHYLVYSKKPYELLVVVKDLRHLGIEISMCKEEKEKYFRILKRKQTFCLNNSVQKIVDYFVNKPTDFENLCAQVYETMGYNVQITPPTNDGGYDLVMMKDDEKTIVECKCYSINHKVGRPSIQKVVGANNVVLADHVIFITTSDYSAAAISYAKEAGVELINGMDFINILLPNFTLADIVLLISSLVSLLLKSFFTKSNIELKSFKSTFPFVCNVI